MNYKILKKIDCLKVVKYLTAAVALFLTSAVIFYSSNITAQTLPDCAPLGASASPGINCSFFALPSCKQLPNSTTPQPRVNCADIIDLPLCTDVASSKLSGVFPGKNCVKECGDASFVNPNGNATPALVRGLDYAVHNQQCIRFCDSPESGFTQALKPGINCVSRKCHQVKSDVTPAPDNCTSLPCNLLTVDELNNPRFDFNPPDDYDPDDAAAPIPKKYCDGDSVKCYQFEKEKLHYVATRIRPVNGLCKRHNCPIPSPSCGTDEIAIINAKGNDYTSTYINEITQNNGLESIYFCEPIQCVPPVNIPYICSATDKNGNTTVDENGSPTTRNDNCVDLKGNYTTCDGGICNREVDCNIGDNKKLDVCVTSSESESGSIGTLEDITSAWFYRPKPIEGGNKIKMDSFLQFSNSNFCYRKWDFLHKWGDYTWPFYYHYATSKASKSPGVCGVSKSVTRGTGYGYLCGTKGNLYNSVSSDGAYHKGYVLTDFVENDATHQLQVCVRYNNIMYPKSTCGLRECAVSCATSRCDFQFCGNEVCRTLTLTDSNPQDCIMTNSLANGNPNKSCMSRLGGGASMDSYLRVRAVKYGNKICTFLDVKGQLAYKSMFLNGTEKISQTMADGSIEEHCLSGQLDPVSHSCINGKNSNDDKGQANKWRVNLKIPYIQAATSVSYDGYLDRDGRLFNSQDCIKVPLRIPPPVLYNVITANNYPKIFTPQVYISSAMIRKGGSVSSGSNGNLGVTDFDYPEIQVRVGLNTVKLSLGIGFDGTETVNADPRGIAKVDANIPGSNYVADLSVKKGFDNNNNPIFCLFEKLTNSAGEIITTSRGCVKRQLPDIDNSAERAVDPTLTAKKTIISRVNVPNQLNNSKISAQYCDSDSCTSAVMLSNPDTTSLSCSYESERYKICSKREECTRLNVECLQNEIDMQAAYSLNPNQSLSQFLDKRDECNNILLPYCNAKRGIVNSQGSTILDQNHASLPANPKYYGWFNEICIVSGFESKLKMVIAKKTDNGLMGKCVINNAKSNPNANCANGGKAPDCICVDAACAIDPTSPYLNDGNPATNCNNGADGTNCLCVAGTQVEPGDDEEIRLQTPREAGLCIDMPLPQTCPVIKYNFNPVPHYNSRGEKDFDYKDSVGKSANDIDISHIYRTSGNDSNPKVVVKGHADFPVSIPGTNDVVGQCLGFWDYSKNSAGAIVRPTMSCVYDNAGNAAWEDGPRNPCIRYSCRAITTSGPNEKSDDTEDGTYQGGYGDGESGADIGKSHGFAKWPEFRKSPNSDSVESYPSTECIDGYKKSEDASHPLTTQKDSNGFIIGYSGGINPTRQCDQLGGFYGSVSNPCVPIKCKKVNLPAVPSSSSDWAAWQAMGGAVFEDIIASRSKNKSLKSPAAFNSVQTGTCNEALGFFKSPGGQSPTLECDSLGNWRNLKNPCVTRCSAINDVTAARSINNGFAFWNAENSVPLGGQVESTASSCASSTNDTYVQYPYPPLRDNNGRAFTIQDSTTFNESYRKDSDSIDGNRNIPDDVSLDTRSTSLPKRVCKSIIITGNSVNVWTGASSNCVNRCPGSATDSRIGVGVTRHVLSTSTKDASGKYNKDTLATINWHDTPLGQDEYYSSCGEISGQYFIGTSEEAKRDNSCYVMRRHCNTNGKWDEPTPVCVAHGSSDPAGSAGGKIGNAYYTTGTTAGISNSSIVGTSLKAASCLDKFWTSDRGTGTLPQRQCSYKDTNQFIDQVYWKLSSGTDCTGVSCLGKTIPSDNSRIAELVITGETAAGISKNLSCFGGITPTTKDPLPALPAIIKSGATKPFVTCQADGTWSEVMNAANCQKSCYVPYVNKCLDPNGCGAGDSYAVGASASYNKRTLKSGEFITFNLDGNCESFGDNALWFFYAACNDGVISQSSSGNFNGGTGKNGANVRRIYSTTSNSWIDGAPYDDEGEIGYTQQHDRLHNSKHSFVDAYGNTHTGAKDYINQTSQSCRN